MFYKIDPTRRQMTFDLVADGFLAGDRIWVDLRGDFSRRRADPRPRMTSSNTTFEMGAKSFDATLPLTVTARKAPLVAVNHDRPLVDNSDPDGDYGVSVKLIAFTGGDDFFSFRGRTELPTVKGSIHRAGAGDDVIVMPTRGGRRLRYRPDVLGRRRRRRRPSGRPRPQARLRPGRRYPGPKGRRHRLGQQGEPRQGRAPRRALRRRPLPGRQRRDPEGRRRPRPAAEVDLQGHP